MNRIVGNVLIVDSAMGNSLVLNSANRIVNIDVFSVSAIRFIANNTTGVLILTEADTSLDVVFRSAVYTQGAGTGTVSPDMLTFASPVKLGNLKAPTVTAGTGFIYLA